MTKLKDVGTVTKFRGLSDVSFVLYSRNEADQKTYDSVAQIYQDSLRFGLVKSDESVEKGTYKVTWFNDGETEHLTGNAGELESDTLQHWVLARKYPRFVEFDANSWRHFASLNRPLVIAVAPKHFEKKYAIFTPSELRTFEKALALIWKFPLPVLTNLRSPWLRSGLLRILSSLASKNTHFIFGRLDSDRYESFASSYIESSAPRPTFFVMDTQRQVYWSNATLPHNKESIEAYLEGIVSGAIPSTSTAVSGIYRMFNQFTQVLGDILEDPVTLGAVVILFVLIVMIAVWFLSSSVSDEEPSKDTPKHASSATIEKHSERPGKVKAD